MESVTRFSGFILPFSLIFIYLYFFSAPMPTDTIPPLWRNAIRMSKQDYKGGKKIKGFKIVLTLTSLREFLITFPCMLFCHLMSHVAVTSEQHEPLLLSASPSITLSPCTSVSCPTSSCLSEQNSNFPSLL